MNGNMCGGRGEELEVVELTTNSIIYSFISFLFHFSHNKCAVALRRHKILSKLFRNFYFYFPLTISLLNMSLTIICFPFPHLLFFMSFSSVVFFAFGASPTNVQTVPVAGGKTNSGGISCYVCNSATKGEADCKEDDQAKLKPFIKQCGKLASGIFKGTEAAACRKVRQTVEDETTIVRECAYTGEEVDGKRRTGNKAVTVLIDQCINDPKAQLPCNFALSPPSGVTLVLASTLFLAISAIFLSF